MEATSFSIDQPLHVLKSRILSWASRFPSYFYLDNNEYGDYHYQRYELIVGVDMVDSLSISGNNPFEELSKFIASPDYYFGWISYDVKNYIEDLSSHNRDELHFPEVVFVKPRYVLSIKDGELQINRRYTEAAHLYDMINKEATSIRQTATDIDWKSRMTEEEYKEKIHMIREKIIAGDFYEMNFCQEFYATDIDLAIPSTFTKLNRAAKAPFSALAKYGDHHLISTSPERFLYRDGKKLISQPIKGTAKREMDEEDNQLIQNKLQNDEKERAENVMIVDLVRNDLTKCAITGSIQVEELCKPYTFEHVNQLISTVSCSLKEGMDLTEILQHTFPMGSMTGAPKIEVMKNIEALETTKRGLYSGTVGYISPDGNFDFNVIIRSLLYNKAKKYLSLQVGGAITYDSKAEKEYEECLIKARGIFDNI